MRSCDSTKQLLRDASLYMNHHAVSLKTPARKLYSGVEMDLYSAVLGPCAKVHSSYLQYIFKTQTKAFLHTQIAHAKIFQKLEGAFVFARYFCDRAVRRCTSAKRRVRVDGHCASSALVDFNTVFYRVSANTYPCPKP